MTHKLQRMNIFILIDALGWEFIKDTPWLADIVKTKKAVKSILGYSSGILPSIVTGKYPEEHGLWSLFYYHPKESPFKWLDKFSWLPSKLLNSRVGRKAAEELTKKISGYTGYFETYCIPVQLLPKFDICERKSIYKPGGFKNCRSIFDLWTEKRVPYTRLDYHTPAHKIFHIASEKIKHSDNSVYFLYTAELDRLLHENCQDVSKIHEALKWYETEIKNIYEAAKNRAEEVNLYIFSDHGMTATIDTIDLKPEIFRLGYRMPKEYIAMYDSTMARFWFFDQKAKRDITDKLRSVKAGRILTDEEIKKHHIDFKNKEYGELIFLMNPGVLISPSFMSNNKPKGMHGFDPSIPSADAMLLSNTEIKEETKDVVALFEIMRKATLD